MTTHHGIAPLIIVLGIAILLALGGGAYVATHPDTFHMESMATTTADVQTAPGDHPEVDHDGNEGVHADAKTTITWKLTTLAERDNIPYTNVTATVNGKVYNTGDYQGSCSEVGANGGVDGKGLLAGELSAVQCWYAGAGDEVGVFAHEDGGYQIMAGSISEPDGEGSTGFRGDFKIKADIKSMLPVGAI